MKRALSVIISVLLISAPCLFAQVNLISNGEFETDATGWGGWINSPTVTVNAVVDATSKLSGVNSYRLDITTASTTTYFIQRNINCPILFGHQYQVSFQAVATDAAGDSSQINVLLEENGGDYSKRLNEMAYVTATPQVFTYTVNYCAETDPGNQLKLHYGGTRNDGDVIWIDAVQVFDLGPSMDIVIDAQRDPFYNTLIGPDDGWVHIPAAMYNNNGMPDNNNDLSADLWVAWDQTYFYMYEEVKDNVVHLNNPTSWQNDVLEVYVDPDPAQAKTSGQLGFNLTALDSGDVADPVNFPGVINLKGYNLDLASTPADYARKTTADGYVLECRVKWDSLKIGTWGPVVPAVGNIFGMSVMNHDNDVAAREASIGWGAILQDAVWNNPQLHGTVEFLADKKLKLIAQNSIVPTNVNEKAWKYVPGADLFDITIDARKDAWYGELTGPDDGYLQLKSYAFNDNGIPKSDVDLSAKMWTAWDDEWLYFYEEVKDDTISMTSANTYQNDGFELKVDPQPTDAATNSTFGLEMTALYDTTATGTAKPGHTNINLPDSVKQFARAKITKGYVLEWAVKWSAIKSGAEVITPAVGNIFGAALQNHDNDNATGARNGTVQWAAVLMDAAWNTPKYDGTVKFLADHKLQYIPSNAMTGVTNPVPYDGTPFYMRIDGKKDPFYRQLTGPDNGYLQLHYFASNNNGEAKSDVDLSAKMWTAWDDEWLYFYEEVKDDTISMTSANTYQNDGFELKVDPLATDSTKNSIFGLEMTAKYDTTATGTAKPGYSNINLPDSVKQFARGTLTKGYVLEWAVKWSAIKAGTPVETVPVGVGNVFGAVLQNHDNDNATGARDATVMWGAVMMDQAWNTPKYLGTVQFLADNKLQYIAKNNMTGKTNDIPYDGSSAVDNKDVPAAELTFQLAQNYPNPFNPTTKITFSIPNSSEVRLSVFDILGREVATLMNEKKSAGSYEVVFDGKDLSSGLYFYRLQAGDKVQTQKMMMLK